MKKLLLLLASVGLFAVGCQNNLTDETIGGSINDGITITVSLNDTRISLGEKDGDGYPVYWDNGDKLVVNGELSEEAQINAENKSSATFQFSKVLSHPFHITYPYCASTTAKTPIVEFPAEQAYTEGTFASGYAPMCGYAESKSNAISLSHLAGVLRFPVIAAHEGVVLEKVVITSQNKIAGKFTVDCQNATISATEGYGNTVTYTLPANYTLSTTTPSEFFITLPAVELGACTIEFVETSGGKMVANWSMNKPLPQGIVREFKTVTYQQKSTISLPSFASEEDEFIIEKPTEVTPTEPASNEIWYTATAKVEPYDQTVFGAIYQSNEWNEATGEGVITFDREITSIGDYAFKDCSSLTSVTFPSSVTSIGMYAFFECSSLACVTIPNGVTTIKHEAFAYCSSLTSVTIGESVTSIGNSAFRGCSSLASVTIPNSVTEIGDYAFYDCSILTSVTVGDNVTEIGVAAFSRCPSLVEFQGKFASKDGRCLILNGILYSFAPAELTAYIIPDSVIEIGNHAFYACGSLTSVTIGNSVTSIGSYAFGGCSSLTSITIPDGVKKIGESAFSNCSSLTGITIPNSVTSIGGYAFYTCASLTSVTIPDSVTEIGDCAFYDCSSLTSVTIGYRITLIGNAAFHGCKSLTMVYCKPITPPTVETFIFKDDIIVVCYVPTASVDVYKSVSSWNDCFSNIVGSDFEAPNVPKNEIWYTSTDGKVITPSNNFGANIVSNTYENGWGVIVFDGEVTSIGNRVFAFCSSLTSVTIGDSVTTIKLEAFAHCSSLTSVTIGDSVKSIDSHAFYDCSKLTSITIPDSVTWIGDHAFYACRSLTNVTIGNSVTSIGNDAFCECTSLTSVYCKATTPPSASWDIFSYYHDNYEEYMPIGCKIYVPRNSVSAYKSAQYWSDYAYYIVGYDF